MTYNAVEFLYAVNTLPTKVTNTNKSLIDNFLCDFSFLPANTNVITTDISDHYAIALHIPNIVFANPVMKLNFCSRNREFFTQKLINYDWSHLYAIKDVNKAVNYCNKKAKKRMYNKAFPFVPVNNTKHKNNPWLTSGILKSIKTKNKLFLQAKFNKALIPNYVKYRNKLTLIIRKAKEQYYRATLDKIGITLQNFSLISTHLLKLNPNPTYPLNLRN